jgi:RNA ligase (TIGR02306 family)
MLKAIKRAYRAEDAVIVYGEIYGKGIQDLTYSESGLSFRVFDVKVDERYLSYITVRDICSAWDVPVVPELYVGTFDQKWVKYYTDEFLEGRSTIGDNVKEGIVIQPLVGRYDGKLGRVILKSISEGYLLRKEGTEYH